jgi:hypothetical protein
LKGFRLASLQRANAKGVIWGWTNGAYDLRGPGPDQTVCAACNLTRIRTAIALATVSRYGATKSDLEHMATGIAWHYGPVGTGEGVDSGARQESASLPRSPASPFSTTSQRLATLARTLACLLARLKKNPPLGKEAWLRRTWVLGDE